MIRHARTHFADVGFVALLVQDVAAAAGIGKSTFFHYFPDKLALYREAVVEPLDALASAVEVAANAKTRDERLTRILSTCHAAFLADRTIAKLLLRGLVDAAPLDHDPIARILSTLSQALGADARAAFAVMSTHYLNGSAPDVAELRQLLINMLPRD